MRHFRLDMRNTARCLAMVGLGSLLWVSIAASDAAAQAITFTSDSRLVEPPDPALDESPSIPFGFFQSSVLEDAVLTSQTSWFTPRRFAGDGHVSSPSPYTGPGETAAFSTGSFGFDLSSTTEVRVQADLVVQGFNATSKLQLSGPTPGNFLVDECAGFDCPAPMAFERNVDVTLTLAPGSYSLWAQGFVLVIAPGLNTADWDVTFTSPPAVPIAGFVAPGLAACLAAFGWTSLRRRRAEPRAS